MNIMTIYTVHIILFQTITVGYMNLCVNIDGTHDCCQGYKFDIVQNTCIPCERGFTGINCTTKCINPTYGQACQSLCDCNATHGYCHHANGCVRFSEYQIQSTTHVNFRTVTKEQRTLESNSTNEAGSLLSRFVINTEFANRMKSRVSKIRTFSKYENCESDTIEIRYRTTDVFNITSNNFTDFKSTVCDTRKRQFKGNNTYMFVIIGIVAVFFIIYMMYCYARVLENRHLNTSSV